MNASRRLLIAAACFLVVSCASPGSRPAADERDALAPGGMLRVGVYPGSPTSLVRDSATGAPKGITYDVGKALAEHLGVQFELVELRALPEVLAAVKAGTVDFTGTNATPARAADMDFTPTVIDIELGFLVVPGSPVSSIADANRPGMRIAVTRGSTSQTTLPRILPNATIVPAPTLKAAGEMLAAHSIDAYATNKVILYELSTTVANSRVLDGQWGVEHWAFAVPKGREKGMAYLRRYLEQADRSGVIARAVERSGLRGAVRPQ